MADQESTSAVKLGKNWRTVALVAVILMVGAVMGHSVLSGDRAVSTGEDGSSACAACPSSGTCSKKAVAAREDACCAGKAQSGVSTEKVTAAVADTADSSPCCASKAQCCTDTEKTAETSSACGGCPFSTASKTE